MAKKIIEVFIDDARLPGGSAEEIKSDYDLDVSFFEDGTFNISGTRKNVDAYINDYGIICEEY